MNKTLFLVTSLFVLSSLTFIGCRTKNNYTELSSKFSISPDDKYIAFSIYKEGIASIYIADINGNNIKRLTYPNNASHTDPEFSPDGTKILFLSYPQDVKSCIGYINIMNKDGSDIKQITSKDENITEAIFFPDGKKIYFLKSGYFGSYSPIAQDRPHKFDIFSINIDGSDEKRITNLEAYNIRSLSITSNGKSILFKRLEYKSKYSVFRISLEEPEKLINVLPEGEQFEPQISPDDKLLAFKDKRKDYKGFFQYELFITDLQNIKIRQLTDLRKNLENPRFFHNENKLLFIFNTNWPNNPPKNQLMQIDLDGSNLKKINIEIPITEMSFN